MSSEFSSESSHSDSDESEIECQKCLLYKKKIAELEKIIHSSSVVEREEDELHIEIPSTEIREEEIKIEGILNLKKERIYTLIELFYTEDLFLQGQEGISHFIYYIVIRDTNVHGKSNDGGENRITYKCIDKEKKIFNYLSNRNEGGNEESKIERDLKCRTLLDSILPFIIKRSHKIYRNILNRLNEVEEGSDDDTDLEEVDELIASEIVGNINTFKNRGSDLQALDGFFKSESEASQGFNLLMNEGDTYDDKVNKLINIFLTIKKSNKNRRHIVDKLIQLEIDDN
jgi:hypothetical protein